MSATEPTDSSAGGQRRWGKRLGSASLVYVAGALATNLAKFLLVPFYVRYLTQAEVGTVVFLQAVSYALARVYPLGLGQAIKRYYVDFADEREADRFTAGIWWVVTGVAVVLSAVLIGTVPAWSQVVGSQIAPSYLVLSIAIAALQGSATIPLMRYIVRQQPGAHTAFSVAQVLTITGAVLWLVAVEGMGVAGVLWGQVGGYAAWAVVAGVVINAPAGWRPRFTRLRESLGYSVVLVPHLLSIWGITFVDRLILESTVSLAALGVYGIGYQLGTLLTIVSISISNAWLAQFFRTGETERGPRTYATTFTAIFVLILFISLGLFVFAPEIIAVVATPAYGGAVVILQLVVVAHVFHAANQFFMLPLFLVKQTTHISTSTGLGLLANVLANVVLIPPFGIVGAAVATVLAYLVAACSSLAFAGRSYPVALEWRTLGIASAVAVGLGAVGAVFAEPTVVGVLAKAGLCVAFPLALFYWPGAPLVDREGLEALRRQLPGLRRPTA
ncbi:lipopolysaccharide biosynthesis protein [Rubrivirga sp.]|uniref:lipopolysaccharide biosynthesis protein n=1 Tax=Rubrivirga sp. TaxID=1885344 RepID=UPI003B528A4B